MQDKLFFAQVVHAITLFIALICLMVLGQKEYQVYIVAVGGAFSLASILYLHWKLYYSSAKKPQPQ